MFKGVNKSASPTPPPFHEMPKYIAKPSTHSIQSTIFFTFYKGSLRSPVRGTDWSGLPDLSPSVTR